MTDSLYPASLQKLHKLDERARGVPGALFDHLDLAGRHTGKRGKASGAKTTGLADRAESFGGHLDALRNRTALDPFDLVRGNPSNGCKMSVTPLVGIAKSEGMAGAASVDCVASIGASNFCGNQIEPFVKFAVGHSNSPKSKGAEAPEGLGAEPFFVCFERSAVTGNVTAATIIGAGQINLIFGVIGSAQFRANVGLCRKKFVVLNHLSISVPDDTLLAHNVQPRKHKVRANDDLLREPDHD